MTQDETEEGQCDRSLLLPHRGRKVATGESDMRRDTTRQHRTRERTCDAGREQTGGAGSGSVGSAEVAGEEQKWEKGLPGSERRLPDVRLCRLLVGTSRDAVVSGAIRVAEPLLSQRQGEQSASGPRCLTLCPVKNFVLTVGK